MIYRDYTPPVGIQFDSVIRILIRSIRVRTGCTASARVLVDTRQADIVLFPRRTSRNQGLRRNPTSCWSPSEMWSSFLGIFLDPAPRSALRKNRNQQPNTFPVPILAGTVLGGKEPVLMRPRVKNNPARTECNQQETPRIPKGDRYQEGTTGSLKIR